MVSVGRRSGVQAMRPTDLSKDLVGSEHGRRLAPKRERARQGWLEATTTGGRALSGQTLPPTAPRSVTHARARERGAGAPPPSTDFETKSFRERKKEADLDRIGLDLLSPVHLVPQRTVENSLREGEESLERRFFFSREGREEGKTKRGGRRGGRFLATSSKGMHTEGR